MREPQLSGLFTAIFGLWIGELNNYIRNQIVMNKLQRMNVRRNRDSMIMWRVPYRRLIHAPLEDLWPDLCDSLFIRDGHFCERVRRLAYIKEKLIDQESDSKEGE